MGTLAPPTTRPNFTAVPTVHETTVHETTVHETTVHESTVHEAEPHARADALLAEAQECADRDTALRLRQQAVVLTLDLADRIARRYAGRGIDLEDLVQVGRMALVKAANGYRTGCGHGFVAYAGPTIAGEIKRHFRDCGWAVRPPRRLQEVRADLSSEQERLTHDLHRDPTTAELAEALGVAPEEVVRARECSAAYRAVSLDLPVDHDSHAVEVVARESLDIDRMLRVDSVLHALHALTERERRIVHLRFVEDRTQSEIGEVLGVSQMQVSRLLSSILAKLRHGLDETERAA
ncbi:sigma-70 family RNA polymerase sigma factor [Pedococcus sp. 2YAF34]|uniref:sigma-70 family RNA polymerase sigma factor n=1 Tax=Pedococcus sp. 2YAF34 TaxID=3233032 RepID=UPI003F976AAC